MALILSRADVERCLDMAEAIEAMRLAFGALSVGQAQAPQRMAVSLAEQGAALLMPSLLQTMRQHVFGLKVVTVMPQNPLRNLPRISASCFYWMPPQVKRRRFSKAAGLQQCVLALSRAWQPACSHARMLMY